MKKAKNLLTLFLVATIFISNFSLNLAYALTDSQKIEYKVSEKSDRLPFKEPNVKAQLPKNFDGEVEVTHKIIDKKTINSKTRYKVKSTAVMKMKIKDKTPLISFKPNAAYAASIIDHPGDTTATITGYLSIWYDIEYQDYVSYYQVYDQEVYWERGTPSMYSLENCYCRYSWDGHKWPDNTRVLYREDTRIWTQPEWTSSSGYTETEKIEAPSSHWGNFPNPVAINYGMYISNFTGADAEIWDRYGYNIGTAIVQFSF